MQPGTIGGWILTLLNERCTRITPSDLNRQVRKAFPQAGNLTVRAAIKELLSRGEIAYTNHFNTTHIERAYRYPISISKRLLLAPPDHRNMDHGGGVVIRLNDGTAFGVGDHPTTRLMLEGIDYLLKAHEAGLPPNRTVALDIGTGSGVLAIAAVRLGVARVLAVDIDPMACMEAESNVHLNKVSDRVLVTQDIHSGFPVGGYGYIFANLRPPTMRHLFPVMHHLSSDVAIWVLSGFREDADDFIHGGLKGLGGTTVWRGRTCGWGATALKVEKRLSRAETR